MRVLLALGLALFVSGCATQRFGRETGLSQIEREEFTCRDIRLETAKTDAFISSIRRERAGLNGAHVLGILGDFGIGNVMEGNEAENSGQVRRAQLQKLAGERQCEPRTAAAAVPGARPSRTPDRADAAKPKRTVERTNARGRVAGFTHIATWASACRAGDATACIMAEATEGSLR